MLFGQGPVGALAGGLGGGIGGMFGGMGGFAGGLAATAVVQSIQSALRCYKKLGQAMKSIRSEHRGSNSSIRINRDQQKTARIKQIEQTQGKTSSLQCFNENMAAVIGQIHGVNSLKQFGENLTVINKFICFSDCKITIIYSNNSKLCCED